MSAENAMDDKRGRRRRRKVEEDEAADIEEIDEEEDDDARGLTERKGRATPGRRTTVEVAQTGNVVTRPLRGALGYLEDVRSELGKVTWPTRAETIRLTTVVLVVSIAAALALGVVVSPIFTALIRIGVESAPILLVIIFVGAIGATIWYVRSSNRGGPGY